MALATSNVNTVTDSFQNWIDKTNTLLDAYSTTIVTTAANSEGGTTTGNGTVNGIFTANSVTVNGNTTFGLRGGNTTVANVLYVTSNVSIGNTSVNTVFTTTTIDTDLALTVLGATTLSNSLSVTGNTSLTGNVTLSGTLQTISGNATFDSGVLFVDATNNRVGINNTAPGVALRLTGDIDVSATANVQGNANVGGIFGVVGNTTLNGSLQTIAGNVNFDTGTLFVDATNNRVGINNTAPGVALQVTGAADISSTANVQGAANVGGTFGVAGVTTLTGNVTMSGALQTISGNVNIDSGVLFVDATNNRIGINTLTPGVAIDVVGAANVTTSVNSSLLTVGTSFVANTTGAYHTGTINAASVTTSGFVANTTAIVPTSNTILLGNNIGRFVLSANTGSFTGTVSGTVADMSTSVNSALVTVGTSFIANTTGVYHTGTVNAASFTSSGFVANTTAIAPTSNTVLLGNTIGRFVVSANTGDFSGQLTVSGITTLSGNATLSGTVQTIAGNSNFDSGVLFVDSVSNRVGINNITPGVAFDVTGAANVSTSVNSALLTVGTAFVANTTGAYHTGTVNAASITLGSSFIANSSAIVGTGFANVTTSVNSALLTVGSNFIANTTGAYHTGTVNAASFTTSGVVSNTTAISPTSNTVLLGNTIGRFVLSANSGNFSGNVVVTGAANVGSSLTVAGNVSINTFATFLTLANTDLGSDTTANVTVVSFPKTSYQAGELLVYVTKGTEFQSTKILFVHNGTDVNQTVYGTVVAPVSSAELANNIALSVNLTNIDVTLKQRIANSSVKIIANMIS
jgi:hypothetical protein